VIARELLPLIGSGQHPRYSPNLHTWIHKNWLKAGERVVVTNDPGMNRYIGLLHEDGWMSGTRLAAVLVNGAKETVWALQPNHHSVKLGVDETFWQRYIQDGRCAIDPGHLVYFVDEETRWKVTGGVRECLWCGHHVQVKLDWTETVNHSAWVPA
jgi:hypothetical protein